MLQPSSDRVSATLRAFVVQFQSDVDIAAGRLSGRVEHVRSGSALHFQSLDELLGFMRASVVADRSWTTANGSGSDEEAQL